MTNTLSGKIALITGASQGMGRAMAERLARDGAEIAVHYRGGREQVDELLGSIVDAGGKATAFQADLAKSDDIDRLFGDIDRHLSGRKLDILIANASAPMVTKPLADVTDDEFDFAFAVNARATFQLLKHAVPRLADKGRVVGFSTPYVERAEAERGVTAASKAALQALVLSLAKELGGRGITANCVMPGATQTESFAAQVPDAYHAQIAGQTPLGRLGQPADIADVVAFLCSDDARWITGQVLKVGGGLI